MKKHILILFLFFVSKIAFGQIVTIPDANFKAALVGNSAINTNMDSEIQVSEANVYSGLINVGNLTITDLTGIEAFTALTELRCDYNSLSSLDVSANTALTDLRCGNNSLSSLDVSANTALTRLDCYFNSLSSLDVSANTALIYLNCYFNSLSSLDISACTALTDLWCYSNPLSSLDVSANTALTYLSCHTNSLSSLDVSANTALTYLSCGDNPLSSLDVSANTALTDLYCFNNNLSSLDVSANTALIDLRCHYNSLSSLDVSANTALTDLYCNNNSLSSLDVSANTALTDLYCYNNSLSSLDATANTALTWLYCYNNSLSSLDVSACTALTYLYCNNNSLTNLDIRNGNNTAISNGNLRININPNLTCVSVDDPVWSAANWTTYVDPQTSFSSNCCGNMQIQIDSTKDYTCTDSGFASVFASGGTLPYSYAWNTTPIDIDSSITVGSGGIYTVSVTDDSTCSRTKGALLDGPSLVGGYDLNSSISARGFRPGRNECLDFHAFNDGCTPASGQVSVVINGLATYDSAAIAPTSINGDTLFWDFANWTYDSIGLITDICVTVDSSANIGDRICFEVMLTPIIGDADTSNNYKTYCFDVGNSYDPNDKQVYPQGVCTENYTQKDEVLTYTVQFQNTGTADALDIYILDTLSSDLDINTLRVISESHKPMITEILEDSIIKFRFDNINLPDSVSNEKASQGYLTYEIYAKSGLADGTVINNSAAIYFDLNPPIITNSTMNTLVDVVPSPTMTVLNEASQTGFTLNGQTYTETGTYNQYFYAADGCDSVVTINLTNTAGISNDLTNITLYPNPFSHYIDVQLEEYRGKNLTITVFDVLGQQKILNQVQDDVVARIDGSRLEKGIYIIQISDEHGVVGRAKVVKE